MLFDTPKVFTESDQETFLTIMSKTQRGRMDEQRCTLTISPKSTPTHAPTKDVSHKGLNLLSLLLHPFLQCLAVCRCFQATSVTVFSFTDADPETFFSLLANSQGRRLDDQRLSLPSLPGIKTGNKISNSASEADAGNLCNVVARAQVGHSGM